MNTRAVRSVALQLVLLAVLLSSSGCFTVVRREPLKFSTLGTEPPRTVAFPAKVVVHDSSSAWDVHQLKDNILCLWEFEFVRVIDMGIDVVIPGREVQPLASGVELIKWGYSFLPDCPPVRIIDGLFSSLGLEKMSISRLSLYFVPRLIYLTDWLQDSLGEINRAVGHVVPWPGPAVPLAVTDPMDDAADWAQNGFLGFYLDVAYEVNVILDKGLRLGEDGWGGVVSVFVPDKDLDPEPEPERAPNDLPQTGVTVVN